MPPRIVQNRGSAQTVFKDVSLPRLVALTRGRMVAWLLDFEAVIARVAACEADSIIGDVESCSLLAALLEQGSLLAGELETCSLLLDQLSAPSLVGDVAAVSLLSGLEERFSSIGDLLGESCITALDERLSVLGGVTAPSTLSSSSESSSASSFAIEGSSLIPCEITPAADPFTTDALAMTFDGAAEYIDCDALLAGIFSVDPITAFTILAFTDGMLSSGPVTIFAMDLGTVAGGLDLTVNSAEVWALQLNSGGGLRQTFIGAGYKLKDEPQVLAAVYDGTESVALDRGRLYLQNEADALISEVGYHPLTGSHLASHPQAASPHGYVGAEPEAGGTPAFFLDATIGSFAIWDVALTLAELVLCIDADHKPTNLAALAVPPALWLRMGDAPLDAGDASSLANAGTAGGVATPVAMDASNYVVWP